MLEENILAGLLYCLPSSSPARVPDAEPQGVNYLAKSLLHGLSVRREGVKSFQVEVQLMFIVLQYNMST